MARDTDFWTERTSMGVRLIYRGQPVTCACASRSEANIERLSFINRVRKTADRHGGAIDRWGQKPPSKDDTHPKTDREIVDDCVIALNAAIEALGENEAAKQLRQMRDEFRLSLTDILAVDLVRAFRVD